MSWTEPCTVLYLHELHNVSSDQPPHSRGQTLDYSHVKTGSERVLRQNAQIPERSFSHFCKILGRKNSKQNIVSFAFGNIAMKMVLFNYYLTMCHLDLKTLISEEKNMR